MSRYMNKTYDDTDPALQYGGDSWTHGTWNASYTGETGTFSTSNGLVDTNITFVFPEAAIGFYYYGIRRARGGTYGMCVDCDLNNPNFETIDAVNITDDGKNPPVLLYSKKFSTLASHRIILRNEPDIRFPNNNSQLNIDRFELEILNPNPNPSPSIITITSSTQTSNPSIDPSPNNQTNLGAIIGGALGGLAAIILALALLFWRWKRKQPVSRADTLGVEGFDPHPTHTPYYMSETRNTSTMGIAHAKARHIQGVRTDTPATHGPGPSFGGSSNWTMPTSSNSSGPQASAAAMRRDPVPTFSSGRSDAGETALPEYEQLFHGGSMIAASAPPSVRVENIVTVNEKS